jgi:hypothetical protein
MPAPKVLTAGGAASSSLPFYNNRSSNSNSNNNNKKSKNNNKNNSNQSSHAAASSSISADDQESSDRAAGSAPSSPIKSENKLIDPNLDPSSIHQALSAGLSSRSRSRSSNGNISYDEEEDHSEMHGLLSDDKEAQQQLDDLYDTQENCTNQSFDNHDSLNSQGKVIWLAICFFGIMMSFVGYGLLLEYATSGGRKLHELSFLFVTSLLYTCTAAAGRHVRDETPTTIPPARFAVLGMTSMGSTFCSVRSLR